MKTKIMTWIILCAFMVNAGALSRSWAVESNAAMRTDNMKSESSAGNGDGFTLVGNWPGADIPIHYPELPKEHLEKLKEEVLKYAGDGGMTYQDLFAPGDQLAFDTAQAEIYRIVEWVSENFFKMKQAVVRAVIAIKRVEEQNPDRIDTTVALYRNYIRELMLNALSSLAYVDYHNDGDSVEIRSVQSRFAEAARMCKTEVCVFEIHKIATELLELSIAWDKKVKFQKMNSSKGGVFIDAKHPVIKGTVAKYVSKKVAGNSPEDLRMGLTAVTDLGFVETITPTEVTQDFKRIVKKLNFEPEMYDRTDSRYGVMSYPSMYKKGWDDYKADWSRSGGSMFLCHLIGLCEVGVVVGAVVFSIHRGVKITFHNPKSQLRELLEETFNQIAQSKLRGVIN